MARGLYLRRAPIHRRATRQGTRMPEKTQFVIAHVDDDALERGGLRWCLALEEGDGALKPLVWVRSREEAEHLQRVFEAESEESLATAQTGVSRPAPSKKSPPLSLLEWIALA